MWEVKKAWYNFWIDSNIWSHKYEKEAVFKPGTCYSFTIDDKGKTLCDDNCPFSIDLREKQSIAVSHLWMPIGNNWTNWLMQ